MGERARDGSFVILKSITDKLIADFNHHSVTGLDSNPVMTRTVTDRTPEPYIYVNEVDSQETWVTKDSESRVYTVNCQVVIRDEVGRGTTQMRDEIVNQILENITDPDDYPDPTGEGYEVQVVTTNNVVKYDTIEKGAKFYIANVILDITAYYRGFAESQPVGVQAFTYADFENTPAGGQIEKYDGGEITVTDSHADSNGWSYESVSVAKSQGHNDGTLEENILRVTSSDENIGITSTFTFEKDGTTTTVTDTDNFTRIISLRHGVITSDDQPVFTDDFTDGTGIRNLDNFTGTGKTFDFRNTNPDGDEITIAGDAGQWQYIIIDSSHTLTEIEESVFNQNILTDSFDASVVGSYRVYLSKMAIGYDGTSYTYTLAT